MSKSVAPIENMSFEAALAELEAIVRALEGGQTPLEESITAYERGTALRQHCENCLKDAHMRVEKINLDPSGQPVGTSPFTESINP